MRKAIALMVLCASLGMAQFVLAQGAGNVPPGSQTIPYEPSGPDGPGWYPTPSTGAIWLDPNGESWIKTLEQGTTPWAVHETIPFRDPPPTTGLPAIDITDWHEEILTPGWEWAPDSVMVTADLNDGNGPQPVSGLDIQMMPGNENHGGAVWIFFDPIKPPFTLHVWKELIWTVPGTAPTYPIVIREYPTPEPATAGLLGLAGMLFLRRRRR